MSDKWYAGNAADDSATTADGLSVISSTHLAEKCARQLT
jgi:hypothetical protein